MAHMNAQVDLDALTASLAQFENAFKLEAKEGRIAELLNDSGRKMKIGIARFAPESKSNYIEVDLSVDLLGSTWVNLAEVPYWPLSFTRANKYESFNLFSTLLDEEFEQLELGTC